MNVGDLDTPVNLGNPAEMRIADLAERIIALTGSRSEVVFRPLPQDDPTQRCPDISRARELLRWEPKIPLEEGLKRTIAYFEALMTQQQDTVRPLIRRAIR
jgi:UDP-glucuronate decarboxylase